MDRNPHFEGALCETPSRPQLSTVRLVKSDRGASLVEVALLLPFLGMLLLGVIDYGRAYYLGIEVQNAAHAGALYGIQNLTDITGIQSAAVTDAVNVPSFTSSNVTVANGCECSDGTSITPSTTQTVNACPTPPSCTGTVSLVNYVKVTTTYNYTTWFHSWVIPGIPTTITLNGSAKLRQ